MSDSATAIDLFSFDNTYARDLGGCYVPWQPAPVPDPVMMRFNDRLADELGLDADALGGELGARIFGGCEVPAGASPLAQAYAGHQFGHFVPQLGDGRALLLGEVVDRRGSRRDIAFKGSGRTPFSRGGDGKAAVGPVLREFVIGEAMHALGIPTTRALAAVRTGERILREQPLPGAVLTRVAASHIRVGTFQCFAVRGDVQTLRTLADYTIARHDPELAGRPDRYLALLRAVTERQAALLAQWMLVGFIHGVMNTDNMAISGETIDYGPCAFMEGFGSNAVFSSIDHGGRYAYQNQPGIAAWNLARFAETLLPLIDDSSERAVALATDVIEAFPGLYDARWLDGMRGKLGLTTAQGGDTRLAEDWLALLEHEHIDWTLAWRRLADVSEASVVGAASDPSQLAALFTNPEPLVAWLERWRARCADESIAPAERSAAMRRVNPIYIPRNHKVEEALTAASNAFDLSLFDRLLDIVTHPFEERSGSEDVATPAPRDVTAGYRTFCGT